MKCHSKDRNSHASLQWKFLKITPQAPLQVQTSVQRESCLFHTSSVRIWNKMLPMSQSDLWKCKMWKKKEYQLVFIWSFTLRQRTYFSRERNPLLHNHSLFMSFLFGSTHIYEKLFSRRKHRKSKISFKTSDENPKSSLRSSLPLK